MESFRHVSILRDTIAEAVTGTGKGIFLDGTLGGGGHAEAVLSRLSPEGKLIGIDRDQEALQAASERLAPFGERFVPVHGNFMQAREILSGMGIDRIQGAVLDLGVSSFQLDTARRGFSYMQDAPLDMRMDPSSELSAYEVVNGYPQDELTRILRDYGEEKFASRIARFIVDRRPVETTFQLSQICTDAIPASARRTGPHPAKRTFQAIRIEVNGELAGLGEAVSDLIGLLEPGGVLAVLTFHSLEDRAVKQAMQRAENPCTCPPGFPVCVCGKKSKGRVITRKPILPTPEEMETNPRSKSAKLRVFEKV